MEKPRPAGAPTEKQERHIDIRREPPRERPVATPKPPAPQPKHETVRTGPKRES